MIIGPLIGNSLCRLFGEEYLNEFNQKVFPPNKWLFLVTGIIFLLAIVPVILMIRKEKAINENTTTK
jgi:hypothetical protein